MDELIEALITIQDVCANNHCENCPFGNEVGDCLIVTRRPLDWTITNEPVVRLLE